MLVLTNYSSLFFLFFSSSFFFLGGGGGGGVLPDLIGLKLCKIIYLRI